MTKRKASSGAADRPEENPWQDFFDALDMIDPGFSFERDQPKEQQVRPSLEGWHIPRRRTKRAR